MRVGLAHVWTTTAYLWNNPANLKVAWTHKLVVLLDGPRSGPRPPRSPPDLTSRRSPGLSVGFDTRGATRSFAPVAILLIACFVARFDAGSVARFDTRFVARGATRVDTGAGRHAPQQRHGGACCGRRTIGPPGMGSCGSGYTPPRESMCDLGSSGDGKPRTWQATQAGAYMHANINNCVLS